MNKNERLLEKLSLIDEKYVEEAAIKMKRTSHSYSTLIGAVVCLVIMIGMSLYLFIPFKAPVTDLSLYSDSEYFPIIEKIAAYRYKPNAYKNNFEKISASIRKNGVALGDALEPTESTPVNGSYVEATDNQVSGVIEADIIKRTDKYIFRLGSNDAHSIALTVYSIEKDESQLVSTYALPIFEDEKYTHISGIEMYLSTDANTVTVIKEYRTSSDVRIALIALDVSDVSAIEEKSHVIIDGAYNTSRMRDGRLLLITEYYASAGSIDYSNPETFVPKITRGGESKCIEFEDIVYPEKLGNLRYSVITLFDEGNLALLGANALLSFGDTVYVSENNVYATSGYTKNTESYTDNVTKNMTDIAVIEYSDGQLTKNGIITVEGSLKNQYSLDEREGHLRVVASTSKREVLKDGNTASSKTDRNVNLYVISLESKETVAEVIGFAPDGESAESVRFDGDKAYVCTAIIETFTDPVYFFDLSDYENITYTDTGYIDGFSTSLISLNGGFLLGIGREDSTRIKIEVYEERNGEVVSVDAITFVGAYSESYKSYLVDRENNLFGFGFWSAKNTDEYEWANYYLLLHFDGYELSVLSSTKLDSPPERMRGVFQDGYLYITTDTQITPVRIFDEA